MSDNHRLILEKLKRLRELTDRATLTPWYSTESNDTWSLHGETRHLKIKGGIAPSTQILKAPKRGTQYAEFWPNEADGELITTAINYFPFFLDWAENVARRHFPTLCGCSNAHFLCAVDREYEWHNCPEVLALHRALDMIHG